MLTILSTGIPRVAEAEVDRQTRESERSLPKLWMLVIPRKKSKVCPRIGQIGTKSIRP